MAMIKRFFFGKDAAGNRVVQLTKPGVDLASAGPNDYLLGGPNPVAQPAYTQVVSLVAREVKTIPHPVTFSNPPALFIRTLRTKNSESFIEEPYSTYGAGDGGVFYNSTASHIEIWSQTARDVFLVVINQEQK